MKLKRAYDKPEPQDGTRILVDRVWPRGISKQELKVDIWAKEAAPSTALRKWFGHDPARWAEFEARYFRELDTNPDAWSTIENAAKQGPVTLIYGARDTEHNNAVALAKYLQSAHAKHHAAPKQR